MRWVSCRARASRAERNIWCSEMSLRESSAWRIRSRRPRRLVPRRLGLGLGLGLRLGLGLGLGLRVRVGVGLRVRVGAGVKVRIGLG